MFDDFFKKARELCDSNTPFATATVVRAEKPTSGKPGDKAIIMLDGSIEGWIGGSCAQPTVIREAQIAMKEGKSRFIRLSNENDPAAPRDDLIIFPMTCYSEGSLEIFIEPHLPQPQLMVIGTMPIAQALMRLGQAMQYRVIAVDPEHAGIDFSAAKTVIHNLGGVMQQINPNTYVVVASHGNYDEAALEHVLKAKPHYIGLVASKKRFETIAEYLKMQKFTDDDLKAIKAPAGLDIHAKGADEIALSIMAEIVQIRRTSKEAYEWATISLAEPVEDKLTAIDPVCGMEVTIAKAKASYEYEGKTYYFCCNGCKSEFANNPQEYLKSKIAIDPVCKMEVEIATAHYISEYEGETYYFCCAGCKTSFDKNPTAYLELAQKT